MPEKDGGSSFPNAWRTCASRSGFCARQFNELTAAVQQYSESVIRFNQELSTLGSQLAAEYAKLRDRLMKCNAIPGVIEHEFDYLDVLNRHYTDELTRLFGFGGMIKPGVMAWGNGKGPHEAALNASQRNGRISR